MSLFLANLRVKSSLFLYSLFFIFSAISSFSATIGVHPNSIPTNGTFLGPQAIIFAPIDSAACLNAASLPTPEADTFADERKGGTSNKLNSSERNSSITAMKLAYSPKRGNDPQLLYAGASIVSRTFGLGLGYFGAISDKRSTNGGFAGIGFKWDSVRLGLSYRNADLTSKTVGDIDFSFLIIGTRETRPPTGGTNTTAGPSHAAEIRKGFSFGGVLSNVNDSPRLDVGIGYVSSKIFNMELNVNTPRSEQLAHGDYILIAATNFSLPPKMTVHLQLNYHTNPAKPEPLVALSYWFTPVANTMVQYTAPNIWSFGLSIMF